MRSAREMPRFLSEFRTLMHNAKGQITDLPPAFNLPASNSMTLQFALRNPAFKRRLSLNMLRLIEYNRRIPRHKSEATLHPCDGSRCIDLIAPSLKLVNWSKGKEMIANSANGETGISHPQRGRRGSTGMQLRIPRDSAHIRRASKYWWNHTFRARMCDISRLLKPPCRGLRSTKLTFRMCELLFSVAIFVAYYACSTRVWPFVASVCSTLLFSS